LIAQFASDCSRFFEACAAEEFARGDQIFLTTVSELELMGLAIFLAGNPTSRLATWHLQFHFNLFDGRTPEFECQSEVLRKVRGCFLAAMSRVPDHDLNFYCTSEELTEQYDQLKVAAFQELPYPINSKFAPAKRANAAYASSRSMTSSRDLKVFEFSQSAFEESPSFDSAEPQLFEPQGPLRMVVPGELRREKGSALHLQKVVDELWGDYLSTGQLEIAVQRPRRKMLRRTKLELSLPADSNVGSSSPIEYLDHPLSEEDYCDFLRGSDFGLLLHDSRAYYSRRAGVLGELLSCGKPVIVPAGCWLAHQLEGQQFRYLEGLQHSLGDARTVDLKGMSFDSDNAPLSGGIVSFDKHRHPFRARMSKPVGENVAILSFDWHHPVSRGVDALIRVNCDGVGQTFSQVVGHRNDAGKCLAIFRLEESATSVFFEIENAFHDSTALIRNLTVDFFNVPDSTEVPLGANGLVYANVDSIPIAVADIVANSVHYKKRAEKFAHRWWRAHDPRRTLSFLINGDESLRVGVRKG
jgi:hypothetical protein